MNNSTATTNQKNIGFNFLASLTAQQLNCVTDNPSDKIEFFNFTKKQTNMGKFDKKIDD